MRDDIDFKLDHFIESGEMLEDIPLSKKPTTVTKAEVIEKEPKVELEKKKTENSDSKKVKNKEKSKNKKKKEKHDIKDKDKLIDKMIMQTRLDKKDFVLLGGVGIVAIHTAFLLFRYIYCLIYLDRVILSNNPIYLFVATVFPFIVWLYSTLNPMFVYHNRKLVFMFVCVLNAMLTVVEPVYSFAWRLIVKKIIAIEPNAAMSEGFILNMARFFMVIVLALAFVVIVRLLSPICFSKEAQDRVMSYTLSDTFDTRKKRHNRYDLKIMRDLKSGADIVIYEVDRFLHVLVNGTTGTGKTSSVYLPSVNNDLKVKAKNMEYRQKELLSMVLKEEASISSEFETATEFSESFIIPSNEEAEKKIEQLNSEYPDCGMTVLAPNNGHIAKIIKLARANGNIRVNVLDPSKRYENEYSNARDVGLNPFYIPFGLDENERAIMIKNKAQMFSEVLIEINERDSSSDTYFRDINTSVTTNIAIIIMLYKNMIGEQANIVDVQVAINNPLFLKPYVEYIEKEYGMTVVANAPVKVKNNKSNGKTGFGALTPEALAEVKLPGDEDISEESVEIDENKAAGISLDTLDKLRKDIENPYYLIILYFKSEFDGEGGKDMFSQSRGLRNLINKFLMNPRMLDILKADDEHMLDMDEMLRDNQITVINTAIDYGQTSSSGFGLFFLLLFELAVYRRPGDEDSRSAHFIYIDEAPQYMCPNFERYAMLFRQYRVGTVFAVQSLNQFMKTKSSEFIGKIMVGLGTQVVYGRVSAQEMDLYSQLSGEKDVTMSQLSTTYASLLDEDGKMGFSERTTPTKEANISGTDVRNRRFQEGTVFYVREGSVCEPKLCKFSFVPKADFEVGTNKYKLVNWEQFKNEQKQPIEVDTEKDVKAIEKIDKTVKELAAAPNVIIEDKKVVSEDDSVSSYISALQSLNSSVTEDDEDI